MQAINKLKGTGIPFFRSNVDTDQIIPARFIMKPRNYNYSTALFADLRFGDKAEDDFPFNNEVYKHASIVITGLNFGCGSAREQAVYALQDYGIKVLIGPGFGNIFYRNCIGNGMLPAVIDAQTATELDRKIQARPDIVLAIDLEHKTITSPDGLCVKFYINENDRAQLMSGVDNITSTLKYSSQIDEFEIRYENSPSWKPAPINYL